MVDEEIQTEETQAEINGLKNLLGQIGDPVAKHTAGTITDEEFAEERARQLAYTAAIASLEAGDSVDMAALLDDMRDLVAQPTQEEINAANIDYLLMIGGEE